MNEIQRRTPILIMNFTLVIFFLVACTLSPNLEKIDGITAMHFNSKWYLSELAWSPNGKFMAVTVNEYQNEYVAHIINLDTEDYLAIQNDDRDLNSWRGASWSPDSNSLILHYSSSLDIAIVNASTGEHEQDVWNGSYAVWGNKSDEAVVIDDGIGASGKESPMYLINTDGEQIQRLGRTDAGFTSSSEAFDLSSNGLLIYRYHQNTLIMDVNLNELVGSIDAHSIPRSPSWSPDGELIAYTETVKESHGYQESISFMNLSNSCHTSLDMEVNIKSLDWSPDGKQIAFVTNDSPGKIYFLDLTTGMGKEFLDKHNEQCGT